MVIDSKINFVYSIYTKKYGHINPNIDNEKIYLVFTYQKSYEVDIDSYNDYFPDITSGIFNSRNNSYYCLCYCSFIFFLKIT